MSGTFDVDAANLMVCSSEPLDAQKLWYSTHRFSQSSSCVLTQLFSGSEREDYLHQLALKGMKALAATLFEIPAEPVEDGRIIELPKAVTKLPREKPVNYVLPFRSMFPHPPLGTADSCPESADDMGEVFGCQRYSEEAS